jgi:GntR family transcriptional regulator, gluconate operon transcriptional repressor
VKEQNISLRNQASRNQALRNQALGEQIARELRVQIITGRIEPGTPLVEDTLAETFDTSRGPVRDALRELELEGLVERGPSRRGGLIVKGLTSEDVTELYALREALEGLAVRLASERTGVDGRSAADWSRARRAVTQLREAADSGDALAFADFDMDFHTELYEQSGNHRLVRVWEQFRPTFAVMLNVTTAQDRDLHPSAEAHAELLDAIQRGDGEAAVTMLSAHLLGSSTRLRTALG